MTGLTYFSRSKHLICNVFLFKDDQFLRKNKPVILLRGFNEQVESFMNFVFAMKFH